MMNYEVCVFNNGGYDTLKSFEYASDATKFAKEESKRVNKSVQVFRQMEDDDIGMFLVTEFENGKRCI